nr:MAG TPA: hypothetical protein [Caudoviricetes sp.]
MLWSKIHTLYFWRLNYDYRNNTLGTWSLFDSI